MTLWNPYAVSPTGRPLAPSAPPALRVLGQEATAQQRVWAQQAYYAFVDRARLSPAPNPRGQGRLPDGSPYEIMVVGASTIMTLWPAGGQQPEYADCGILVVPTDNMEQRYLLKPGGRAGRSTRPWKVERKDWTLHSTNAVGIYFLPQFPKITWHAPRGREYLVALEEPTQSQERMGTVVLELNRTVPGSAGVPWVAHGLEGSPRRWITDERPSAAVANSLIYPISETNPTAPGTFPVVRANPDVISIREAIRLDPLYELYEDVSNVYLRADGRRALVSVLGYTGDGSADVPPNTWFPVRGNILRYGIVVTLHSAVAQVDLLLAGDQKASRVVEEHEFDGTAWAKVGNAVEGRIGSCTPEFAEYLQGPTAQTTRIRNYLNWTMTRPTFYARPSAACEYNPGPGGPPNSIGEVLNNSVHGPLNYREWMAAQFNDGANGLSAWYSGDGAICPMRSWGRSSINHDVVGTVDRDFHAFWECYNTDMTGITGMSRWNQVDSVDVTIENVDEEGWFIGGREFVTQSRIYRERRASTVTNVADLITGGGTVTVNGSGSLTVDVAFASRGLLVVDHQLDLIVYVEVKFEYQVQQAASYSFAGSYYDWTNNPASEIGTATGRTGILPDWVVPTCDIVIECRGQTLRYPTTYDPDPDAQLNLRRLMRPNSAMGQYFEKDVVDGGIDRADLARESSFSLAYSGTGMVDSMLLHDPDPAEPRTSMVLGNTSYGIVPGIFENPGAVSAQFAKDPKTGGAVLVLRAQNAERAPGFPVGFAIDSEGARPLGTVLAIGPEDFNTFGSA